MTKICSIYIITNTINEKIYVGQTWDIIQKRLSSHKCVGGKHCTKLYNSLNKYGKNKFNIECIAMCTDQFTADYLEILYIKEYNSIANGYNLRSGGARGKHTEETKKRMSIARHGNNFRTGTKLSEETKKKIGLANMGKIPSAKQRSATSEMNMKRRGRKMPESAKNNISKARQGMKFSEEHKRKMSEVRKGKHWKLINGKRVYLHKLIINS